MGTWPERLGPLEYTRRLLAVFSAPGPSLAVEQIGRIGLTLGKVGRILAASSDHRESRPVAGYAQGRRTVSTFAKGVHGLRRKHQ